MRRALPLHDHRNAQEKRVYISVLMGLFVSIYLVFFRQPHAASQRESISQTYVFPGCHDIMHHYGNGDRWITLGATWKAVSQCTGGYIC